MSSVPRQIAFWAAAGLVFLADVVTPEELSLWVLYVPLLVAAVWWLERRALLALAAGCAVLSVLAIGHMPGNVTLSFLLMNRLGGAAVLALIAWLGVVYGRLADAHRGSATNDARWRQGVKLAGLGLFEHDQRNDEIYWSDEMREICCWGADEPVTLPRFAERLHPDDRQRVLDAIALAHDPQGDGVFSVENRLLYPDGRVCWVEMRSQTFFEGEGDARRPTRTIGVALDVTARELGKRSVESSERFKTALLNALPAHIAVLDRTGRIVAVNERWTRFASDNQEFPKQVDGVGDNYLEACRRAIAAGDASAADALRGIEAVLRGGLESFRIEYPCHSPNQQRWYLLHAIRSPSPELEGAILAHTDITLRVLAEQAMRDSETLARTRLSELQTVYDQLQAIYDHAPVGLCVFDTGMRFLRINDRLAEINGMPVADHLGKTVREVIPDLADAAEQLARKIFETGEPLIDLEVVGQTAAQPGVERVWKESWYPQKDDSGRVVAIHVVAEEITERKRNEQRMQASLLEKEVLLKEIHHRVKNNMQIISSLVSLQADSIQDPYARGILRDVRDRVRSMALVHERLYQSGELSHVDMEVYARDLLHFLWRAHHMASDVRLTLDLQPVWLSVDSAVPCGLLLNELATNALKHAFPSGVGELIVSLRTEDEGRRVVLGVRDDGVGLPAGLDWQESTSLGLRLVRMLGQQIGAEVQVRSERGVDFQIRFAKNP